MLLDIGLNTGKKNGMENPLTDLYPLSFLKFPNHWNLKKLVVGWPEHGNHPGFMESTRQSDIKYSFVTIVIPCGLNQYVLCIKIVGLIEIIINPTGKPCQRYFLNVVSLILKFSLGRVFRFFAPGIRGKRVMVNVSFSSGCI